MARKRLNVGATLSPEIVEWIDGFARERGLDRSRAIEWLAETMRYALRELGEELAREERSAALLGTRMGLATRAEAQRAAQQSARVVTPLSRQK